jgi:hypothetical protein
MSEEGIQYFEHSKDNAEKLDAFKREMAGRYAQTFGTDAGKIVLADLRRKFGSHRLVFQKVSGAFDPIAAAITEGERRVMIEIDNALKDGALMQHPNK